VNQTEPARPPSRTPVLADLLFWSVAGTAVTIFSAPLSRQWDAPRSVLTVLAAGIVAAGLVALLLLRGGGPLPRKIVRACGLGNLAIAPAAFVAAATGLLDLSTAGNWAVTLVGIIALTFGIWQVASSIPAPTLQPLAPERAASAQQ
jgi:hypothetical protein